jgi:16S rRNA (uracil1498-N3)-methyltransferase
MRLFLLPSEFRPDVPLVLKGRDYNYVVNVLRLKEGSRMTGRDRSGKPWNLTIETITSDSCILSVNQAEEATETTDALPETGPKKNIILYQCQPKGRKMDDIIRMATEAGVLSIVPVKSRYCVSDISAKEKSKLARYDAVIKEAVQQSGSLVPTTVESIIDISEVPDHFKKTCEAQNQKGIGLFFHQCSAKEDQKDLVSLLQDFDGTVGILIGSEGGISEDEAKFLISKEFNPVLLKTNILRCETAAIYAVAAVQTIIEN